MALWKHHGEPATSPTRKMPGEAGPIIGHNRGMGGDSTVGLIGEEDSWAGIALALSPVPPPVALRSRLLARIRGEDTHVRVAAESETLFAEEGRWIPVCEGVRRKHLYYDPRMNAATFLLRFEPGATLPLHWHGGTEQCLVLEGEVEDGDITLKQGDFQTLKPGSVHPASRSRQGCLLLIVAAEPGATKFG